MSSIQVDDTDSSITYAPGWFTAGGPGEFQETTHATLSNGKTATFRFKGTQVSVYGTIAPTSRSGPPSSSYSIDGVYQGAYTGRPASDPQYRQAFFVSKTLSDGEHTLVITNTGPSQTTYFWLDYIEYVPSSGSTSVDKATSAAPVSTPKTTPTTTPTTSPTSTPTTAKETSTPSTGSQTQTPSGSLVGSHSPSSTFTGGSSTSYGTIITYNTLSGGSVVASTVTEAIIVPATQSPEASHTSPTGAIVGGAVGGIVALVLIPLLCLFWIRRRRRNKDADTGSTDPEQSHVLPFSGGTGSNAQATGPGSKLGSTDAGSEQEGDLPPAYEVTEVASSTTSLVTGKRSWH